MKRGKLWQALRVALTGTSGSPGIADSVCLLDRDQTLARLDAVIESLAQPAV